MFLSFSLSFLSLFGTLPAVGFIFSFLHLLNLTQYLEHSPRHLAGHLSSYLHLSPELLFLGAGCYVDKGIGKNFLPLPLSITLGSSHHAQKELWNCFLGMALKAALKMIFHLGLVLWGTGMEVPYPILGYLPRSKTWNHHRFIGE